MIEPTLLDRLTSALTPHMTPNQRRPIIERALHGDDLRETILDDIKFDEKDVFEFTRRMLRTLNMFENSETSYIVSVLSYALPATPERDQLTADVRASYNTEPTVSEHRSGSTTAALITHSDDIPDLPAPGIGLVGREIYQKTVRYHIDSNHRALIYGHGGMGKTALVAQVIADWMVEQMKTGSDTKILVVRAGSMDADELLAALAYPLDPQAVAAQDAIADKVNELRRLIRTADVKLVFIDDAWHTAALNAVSQAVPHSIPLVVTSRQRRMSDPVDGVQPVRLPHMENKYAATLMRKIAPEVDHAATPELCQRLANTPFAVRIAAKTMQRQGISAADMLSRIDSRTVDITQLPDEFGEVGRQTFAQLIETSLDALSDEARTVFMTTGAFFAPTITAEMLDIYLNRELVHDDDDPGAWRVGTFHETSRQVNIDAAITQLVEHGLFVPVRATDEAMAHYRSHDLAHAYADARATDDDKRRAAQTCITYTFNYNAPSILNFNALQPELPNFEGASAWAFDHAMWAETERFAWNLYSGSGLTNYRGLYTNALSLLRRAARAAENSGNPRNRSAHLGNLGIAYDDLGQYQQAIDYHERALAISQDIGDKRGEGSDLGNLGNAYANLGQYQQAIDYHQRALAISQDIGDKRGEGSDLGNLGNAYFSLGQYQQAIDYYERALAISQDIGDNRGEGSHLGNLGIAYDDLGSVRAGD